MWKGEEEVRREERGMRGFERKEGMDSGVRGSERQRRGWERRRGLGMG